MSASSLADAAIRTPDQRLRVFVSSTLGELAPERQAVLRAITALRLTPVMFELGARPHPPRELYQAYLAQSDVFVGLYWQRYGRPAPGTHLSGLEEEYELSAALPRLLYVKRPAPDREARLDELLTRVRQEASYRSFRTPAELGRLVRDDLATLLSERFAATATVTARRSPPAPDARGAATAAPAPPPPRPLRRLPVPTTSLVGREQAIEELVELVGRPGARLVTLTGPGGIGKTRLATAVGERLRDRFDGGVVFVPLAAVTRPELVLAGIGVAVGLELGPTDAPLDGLVEHFGDDRWLLVLDNLEQLLDAAHDLDELLSRCPGVAILATSLTLLRLRAEHAYPVPPLRFPASAASVPVDEVASSPAVELFVDRARAVRPGFALTDANVSDVAEICARLEGMPLAIELAAAHVRLLNPRALLRRLTASLDVLDAATVDLPERQRTLRATVEWSLGLLGAAERSLLESATVFVDGWTLEASAAVAGMDEVRALKVTEALADHSLITVDIDGASPRAWMLRPIRELLAERLAGRPDAADVQRRHAAYYYLLAERADRPLRTGGQTEWALRLQTETRNLAAAVRWYLDHDPAPLPHLFRVLSPFRVLGPFWGLSDDVLGEARGCVEQLLPTADALAPQPRAELLWTADVTALEAGDDAAAFAACERLDALVDELGDRYLQALCHVAVAWTSTLAPDLDHAFGAAAASLERLRGEDEPLWTTVVLITLGQIEAATRRFDDAARHLEEARDLAERYGYDWFVAGTRTFLGTLAGEQGRFDDARALLDDALTISVATHSTHSVALALSAWSRLALAEGDAERAALLAGAADGLRRRAGLQLWSSVREKADQLDRVRRALGPARYGAMFAAGARLDQDEAVAAARGVREPLV